MAFQHICIKTNLYIRIIYSFLFTVQRSSELQGTSIHTIFTIMESTWYQLNFLNQIQVFWSEILEWPISPILTFFENKSSWSII